MILDESAAAMLDEQTGDLHSQDPRTRQSASKMQGVTLMGTGESVEYGDTGGASRFFYVAKASSAERNAGLDGFERRQAQKWNEGGIKAAREATARPVANVHPTVKPVELMRWLVRLVTPPGGFVLDPFAGSGTTGAAAVLEGFRFVGIEREAEYAAIARARIEWWSQHPDGVEIVKALEAEKVRTKIRDSGQESLFG